MDNGSDDDKLPDTFNGASAADKAARLESLKESLKRSVLGQQEVVDRIASMMLAGPKGAGKTADSLKAMAKAGKKVTVVNLEDFKNGAMDPEAGRVFYIDEIHLKSEEEIGDAIDTFLGRPTRQQRGEIVAQEFRDGATDKVTCMKPLRYKRGFASASMGF